MKKKIIKNILLIILIIVFLFSMFKMSFFVMELRNNGKVKDELVDDFVKIEKKDDEKEEIISIDFDSLLNINQDIRGWIRFNSDKINYPILQTDNNNYYLNHTYNKKKSSLGSIFMDHRNNYLESKNIVLFGHNSTNGAMFGSLRDTLKDGFFDDDKNKIIEIIDTDNNIHYYEIFSVYKVVKEEYYITTSFNNDEEYADFLNTIKKRSEIDFDVDLSETEYILTLSTCNGVSGTDKRLAIHARLKTE